MGLFSGIYGDHAAARPGTLTYDDPRVVARLVEARSSFRWDGGLAPLYQQLAAALLAAAMRGGGFDGRLSVCDFGGGLGTGHAVLSAILGEAVRLEWDVVETPALAQAGNERFAGNGLRFHASLDALEGRDHDLILVSGVLQYLPDPEAAAARGLSLEDIRAAVTRANSSTPVGTLNGPKQDIAIQASGQINKAIDYRQVVVAWRNGSPVKLDEVARALDTIQAGL